MQPDGFRGSWVAELEGELLIRDFIELMNVEDSGLGEYLSADVVYRPSAGRRISGRGNVMRMLNDIQRSFRTYRISIRNVAACGDVVFVEQILQIAEEEGDTHLLLSFASFRLLDHRIADWHQVHA
jgi:limonene-1,2-epoxide hydrolase